MSLNERFQLFVAELKTRLFRAALYHSSDSTLVIQLVDDLGSQARLLSDTTDTLLRVNAGR